MADLWIKISLQKEGSLACLAGFALPVHSHLRSAAQPQPKHIHRRDAETFLGRTHWMLPFALRPWAEPDLALLRAINRGEFSVNGFRNRDLQSLLFDDAPDNTEEKR